MRVAIVRTFAASRKEPLAEMLDRVHQGFLDVGHGEPSIQFNFGDSPIPGGVSSVDRVLRRHPELARFVTNAAPAVGIPGARRISNGPLSQGAGESIPFATLREIAAGVPRSFPFHSVAIHFHSPEFGKRPSASVQTAEFMAGVLVVDSWWVNGRNRSLSACTIVEADPAAKKLPPPSEALATIFAGCGKIRRTVQVPMAEPGEVAPGVRSTMGVVVPSPNPQAVQAVQPIVLDYRARMAEIVERARLPHDLPASGIEARKEAPLGLSSGPKKPALERVFKPMGYGCRGGVGTFTLSRRTAANLTAELHLDCGTWSHSLLAMFRVFGAGFKATLFLPVTANAIPQAQYPIGNAERWEKIVENLGALVAELDRTFVPDIERAAGPSPAWYRPES